MLADVVAVAHNYYVVRFSLKDVETRRWRLFSSLNFREPIRMMGLKTISCLIAPFKPHFRVEIVTSTIDPFRVGRIETANSRICNLETSTTGVEIMVVKSDIDWGK